MAPSGFYQIGRSTARMQAQRCVAAPLALAIGLGWSKAGMCAPIQAAPEVIAPGAPPQLHTVWSDTTTATPTGGFSVAPMPNDDAATPVVAAKDDAPALQPAFYGRQKEFRGDGFGTGSTAQDVQDRSSKPAAGLALNVPLD